MIILIISCDFWSASAFYSWSPCCCSCPCWQLNLDLHALSLKLTPRLHESHMKGYAPLALAVGCHCFFSTLPGHTTKSPQWTCALCQEPHVISKPVKFVACGAHARGSKHCHKWVDYHTVAKLVKNKHMETSPFAHLKVRCTCAAPSEDEDAMCMPE